MRTYHLVGGSVQALSGLVETSVSRRIFAGYSSHWVSNIGSHLLDPELGVEALAQLISDVDLWLVFEDGYTLLLDVVCVSLGSGSLFHCNGLIFILIDNF